MTKSEAPPAPPGAPAEDVDIDVVWTRRTAGAAAAITAALLAAGPSLAASPAYAADSQTVNFTGGSVLSVLVCKSAPSPPGLTVAAESRVLFVNRLGQTAQFARRRPVSRHRGRQPGGTRGLPLRAGVCLDDVPFRVAGVGSDRPRTTAILDRLSAVGRSGPPARQTHDLLSRKDRGRLAQRR
jgi:hypothetical protein